MSNINIFDAIEDNNLEAVRQYLDQGGNIEVKNIYGRTPLLLAACLGRKETAEYLIDEGANIEAKDKDGWTPLHLAVYYDWKVIAELLIDKEADIEAKNKGGWTPLHCAIYHGKNETAEYLIDKGADIEARGSYGETPLHYAAYWGKKEIARLLIDKGVDIEAKDKDGWTPLYWAVHQNQKELAKLLIKERANIEAKDEDGRTPLDIAKDRENIEIIKLLEDIMSNQRTQESQNYPLHKAIIKTRDESFTESLLNDLLNAGADINGFNNYGYSPLLLACKYGKLNIAKILIQAGADIDAKSYSGHDIVDLLKEDEMLALKESLSPCIVNTTPSFARLTEKCALLEKFITYLESEKSDEQAYYTRKKMIALKHAIASYGLEEIGLDPLFHEMISYLNFLKESYDVKKKEGTLKQFKFAKFLER